METELSQILLGLRDIQGVQGSFVVRAGDGQMVGRDLPSLIDDAILADIGPRIDRLLDIVDSSPATESIALRFGAQRLDIKRMQGAHLCVLSELTASGPALRMAIKLVGRKLEGRPWDVTPAAPSSAPASRTVLFRGRRTSI